ncbi:hypothetical protein [Pararcticibacter amylolyticus]|uniref:Ribosomal protein L7/L12 C-terminal domain-containing protein n=1 Tax=Pararcticibacter amylolyticus TaxID=2173175 RepID=A0A2U2P9P1_9SPHI|nr:hypothetical protein [Pararcticibacter amylolyticus]PWG78014.1 hypothetical protein DDR33_24430 [Pararcticibacter amylolyticus]
MKKIRFTGWKKGVNKIEFIQLLHHNAGISLKEAKQIKDRIVDGEIVEINAKKEAAEYIINQSSNCGFQGEMIEE